MKFRYNISLLEKVIERDKCIINISDYENLNIHSIIKFICHCGCCHQKEFRWINEKGGAFCKNCTKLNKESKKKEYNLRVRGVEHPMHSNEIKQKIKQTNLEKYGTEHPMQSKEIQEKTKKTNLERYGVEYLSQNFNIKEKIKQINLEKIGVENQFQSSKIKDKIKQTNLEKYGVENPSQSENIKQKKRDTTFKNYGVEYPGQSEELRNKAEQFNLKKYGSKYPMQNANISEKSLNNSLKLRNFIFPDNLIIKVQGYEPNALQILVDHGYISEDIITSRLYVPEIWYKDLENIKHRYYCDIYIPFENRIIEVKSTWTYEKDLHINTLKAETCKELGYNFEFWIFDRKMKCEILKFYTEIIQYGDSIPGYEKITIGKKEPGRSGLHICLNAYDITVKDFADSIETNWGEYRGFKIGDSTINNKEFKNLENDNYYTRTHEGFQKVKKVIRHTTTKKLYRIKAIDSDGNIHQVVVTEGHSLILANKRKIAAQKLVIGSHLYDYR